MATYFLSKCEIVIGPDSYLLHVKELTAMKTFVCSLILYNSQHSLVIRLYFNGGFYCGYVAVTKTFV